MRTSSLTVVLSLAVLAAASAANPYVLTILSEVSVPESGSPWVELHPAPDGQSLDLNGWLIVTSSSVCTLTCSISADEYLVIDSAAIAEGRLGHGSFSLNPIADSLVIVPDTAEQRPGEQVTYPLLPSGWERAPAPPLGASIAFVNIPNAWNQVLNWYVDSTPTPGDSNNDWSSVEVTVTWDSSLAVAEGQVYITGTYGSSSPSFMYPGPLSLDGLGAGRYRLRASAMTRTHELIHTEYPESLDVGYCQRVTGINLHFSVEGVEEHGSPAARRPARATAIRGAIVLDDGRCGAELLDAAGRRVMGLRPGANDVSSLSPGVYFVRTANCDGLETNTKVVIQR